MHYRFRDAISALTAEDVLGAAQRHLHPDQQVSRMVHVGMYIMRMTYRRNMYTCTRFQPTIDTHITTTKSHVHALQHALIFLCVGTLHSVKLTFELAA